MSNLENPNNIAPALTLMDGIVGALAPRSETFPVLLGSIAFEFRYLKDGDDWKHVGEKARRDSETIGGRACPVELRPYKLDNKEHLAWAFMLAALSVDAIETLPLPDDAEAGQERETKSWGPQPAIEWLKLAKDATPAFETIKAQVNEEITGNVRLSELEAIKAGKVA